MRQNQITQKGKACANKVVPDQTVHLGAARQRSWLYFSKMFISGSVVVLNFRSICVVHEAGSRLSEGTVMYP